MPRRNFKLTSEPNIGKIYSLCCFTLIWLFTDNFKIVNAAKIYMNKSKQSLLQEIQLAPIYSKSDYTGVHKVGSAFTEWIIPLFTYILRDLCETLEGKNCY